MRSPIRQVVQPLVAGGLAGPWILLDYVARTFNVGLFVAPSQDASGITYTVDITPDNPNTVNRNPVASITRSGTTVTVTMTNAHGVATGDNAVVWNSGDPNMDGSWPIASTPSDTQFTYTAANATATAGSVYTKSSQQRVYPAATNLTAATTRQSASLQEPCVAVRLRITAWTAGSATLEVVQGLARG